jgi:HK97 family phage major capsid protein
MSQFNMPDPIREQQRANTARELAAYYTEMATPAPEEKFSVMKMLRAMSEQTFQSGSSYEANLVEAAVISQGRSFDPQRAVVPWAALAKRDLSAGTPSAGGNLVGRQTMTAADVLRPYSVAARLGVTVLENQMQDIAIPNLSEPTRGSWLATETSDIVTVDPVIGLTIAKPKTAGAVLRASRQLIMRTTDCEGFIRQQLVAAMGELLDQAILGGTGANGQPTGLKFAPNVNDSTGPLLELINVLAMETVVADAGGDDANLKFVTTPNMRGLLKQTPFSDWGERKLWQDGKLVDVPAYVTPHCPYTMLFLGDWSQCQVALWGAGLDIQVDPYTSFKTGAIQVRILMHCDVSFLKPQSFFRWTLT